MAMDAETFERLSAALRRVEANAALLRADPDG